MLTPETLEDRIQLKSFTDKYLVSSVWRHHLPIRETMVFPALDGKVTVYRDLYCERHDSIAEMEEAHKRILEMVSAPDWEPTAYENFYWTGIYPWTNDNDNKDKENQHECK